MHRMSIMSILFPHPSVLLRVPKKIKVVLKSRSGVLYMFSFNFSTHLMELLK